MNGPGLADRKGIDMTQDTEGMTRDDLEAEVARLNKSLNAAAVAGVGQRSATRSAEQALTEARKDNADLARQLSTASETIGRVTALADDWENIGWSAFGGAVLDALDPSRVPPFDDTGAIHSLRPTDDAGVSR